MKLLRPDSPWVIDGEASDTEVVIAATPEELGLLSNSLNEAMEAIEDWEFETRLGGIPGEALALMSKIKEVLHETRRPE